MRLKDIEAAALRGYYKRNFGPLSGRDWIRRLPEEERVVFSEVGRKLADHGKLGGIARARTANRDNQGRFTYGRKRSKN